MGWFIPLIFFFVFGTASFLLRRYLAQRIPEDNTLTNLVFYVLFLLPAALLAGWLLPHGSLVPPPDVLFILVLASLVWPFYFLASFRAAKDIDAGVLSLLTDMSAVVTLVLAYIVLGERLALPQVIGVVCLIGSGAVAMWPDLRRSHTVKLLGIEMALVSLVLLGVGVVIDKIALQRAEIGTYLLYTWGLQAVWMAFISRKDIKRLPRFLSRHNPLRGKVLAYGAVGVLRSLAFSLALLFAVSPTTMNAGSNFLSITVIVAAFIFLGERSHIGYKLAGAVVGLLGLFLIM
jgi:drug/metabolite transporter (DMT)-like permease